MCFASQHLKVEKVWILNSECFCSTERYKLNVLLVVGLWLDLNIQILKCMAESYQSPEESGRVVKKHMYYSQNASYRSTLPYKTSIVLLLTINIVQYCMWNFWSLITGKIKRRLAKTHVWSLAVYGNLCSSVKIHICQLTCTICIFSLYTTWYWLKMYRP